MAKMIPYTFQKYEIPHEGTFITDDNGYPLLDEIEEFLYPILARKYSVPMVPLKPEIHKQIKDRLTPEDTVGEPVELADEKTSETDEIVTLKPDAARRIFREVLKHYQEE